MANSAERRDGQASLNPALVKESFARIEPVADKAMAYFHGRLFAASPELRAFFPLAMDRQRDRFFRGHDGEVRRHDGQLHRAFGLRHLGNVFRQQRGHL